MKSSSLLVGLAAATYVGVLLVKKKKLKKFSTQPGLQAFYSITQSLDERKI